MFNIYGMSVLVSVFLIPLGFILNFVYLWFFLSLLRS